MSNYAIQVEGLSKRYRLGLQKKQATSIPAALNDLLLGPVRNLKHLRSLSNFGENSNPNSVLWALNDVSFNIEHGEVVGVIGHNGSGKSTLLKILSKITEPTAGRVTLRGRVGSLLEVGTGFSPELTGRENVYLNGAILGMSRGEITRKFDEIVDFSGVEQFIDTPVKHYSSGMSVRLAFSVAAHLEPEILLVDEVLAVGDAEFQQKCLGKMNSAADGGRTIIFVSHNMGAIQRLCQRVIVLKNGNLEFNGTTSEGVEHYLKPLWKAGNGVLADSAGYSNSDGTIQVTGLLITSNGEYGEAGYPSGEPLEFSVSVRCDKETAGAALAINIYDQLGQHVTSLRSKYPNQLDRNIRVGPGVSSFKCVVKDAGLVPGTYLVSFDFETAKGTQIQAQEAARLQIIESAVCPPTLGRFSGVVMFPQRWAVEQETAV